MVWAPLLESRRVPWFCTVCGLFPMVFLKIFCGFATTVWFINIPCYLIVFIPYINVPYFFVLSTQYYTGWKRRRPYLPSHQDSFPSGLFWSFFGYNYIITGSDECIRGYSSALVSRHINVCLDDTMGSQDIKYSPLTMLQTYPAIVWHTIY